MKVLISCDYSEAGKQVLHEAQKFLTAFPGAEIHIFSVIDISVISAAGMYNNGELLKSLELDGVELGKKAEHIFGDIKVHFSTELGYPIETILKKAKSISADLLVLGTHGRTGLGRILIGSVAENILRHTSCNTLVVPVKHLKNGENTTG